MPEQKAGEKMRQGWLLSDKDAVEIYGWLAIPRFAAVTLAVVAIISLWVAGRLQFDPRPPLYVLIPAFLTLSAGTWTLVRRGTFPREALYAQIFLDFLAITIGLFLTGGAHSPFVPMYVLVVVSAGAVSANIALLIGGLAITSLAALTWSDHVSGLAASPGMSNVTQNELAAIVILAAIIALVTFQSRFYVTRIRQKDDELLRLKDEFLFRTIHDLRSPSTIIRLVVDKYTDPKLFALLPGLEKDIGFVSTALGRMTALIEDLLKIGRGEATDFQPRKDRVDLSRVVAGAVNELTLAAQKKRVRVTHKTQAGLLVIGDAEKLKEVFNNFIDNAIKYNRDGGSVAVVHRREGRKFVTEISDTGIGISPESQVKLFTPYFRGDVGKETPGTGLGLAMTKRLVERMGGTISTRSEKGKGTTFSVALPAAPAKR